MISEAFVDRYGTRVTVRIQDGHDHVQLLLTYADGSEPTSYGFAIDDFAFLCKAAAKVDEQIREGRPVAS